VSDSGCPPSRGPLSCMQGVRSRLQVLPRMLKGHTRGRRVCPLSMMESVVATTMTSVASGRVGRTAGSADPGQSSADLGQPANRSAFTGVAEGIELLVPGLTERSGHL